MKYKKGLIFICLIICLFSIACVVASDINETDVITKNQDNLIEIENNNSIDYEDNNYLNYQDEQPISQNSTENLQNEISHAQNGQTIHLNEDYIHDYPITISKSITIDGHNHILTCSNYDFQIKADKVTLKNIIFKSNNKNSAQMYWIGKSGELINCSFINIGGSSIGGAVYWSGDLGKISKCIFKYAHSEKKGGAIAVWGDKCSISDCEFYHNSAYSGGAIFISGNLDKIDNCTFDNCIAEYEGGAIYSINAEISNSKFTNNRASAIGGAIFALDDFNELKNSVFENNHAQYGGAIYVHSWMYIDNSTFIKNEASLNGGAIHGGRTFTQGCTLFNCTFRENLANLGGAVFGQSFMYDSNFTENRAYDGGAVYLKIESEVFNCLFESNNGNNNGGAFYFSGHDIVINNSTFNFNHCNKCGGAIYVNSSNGNITKCNFKDNSAEDGGAITIENLNYINNSNFMNNHAKHGDAIRWLRSTCPIVNCTFNNLSTQYNKYLFITPKLYSLPFSITAKNIKFKEIAEIEVNLLDLGYYEHMMNIEVYDSDSNKIFNTSFELSSSFDYYNFKIPNLNYGEYEIIVDFKGDNIYSSDIVNKFFSVYGESIDSSLIEIQYSSKEGIIILTLPDVANGFVTFTLYNGVSEKSEVINGTAIMKAPWLSIDFYDCDIYYHGGDKYAPFKISRSFSVFEQYTPSNSNNVIIPSSISSSGIKTIIKITLSLKKVKVKKSAKKLVLQATLKQGKNSLINKKITLKFNGKTYKAKTNKKGIAKVTIKSKILKKLKVGKKVKYQASYGKITVKKTAKVKR